MASIARGNRLRYLTSDEIDHIVSVIAEPRGPLSSVNESIVISMRDTYRKMLQYEQISPDGIEELRTEFMVKQRQAQVLPGKTAGLQAAEAEMKPVMQTALNTFHNSGSSKSVSGGIKQIQGLMRQHTPSKVYITILFKKILDFDTIFLKKRIDIVEVRLDQLLDNMAYNAIDIMTTDVEPLEGTPPFWYY